MRKMKLLVMDEEIAACKALKTILEGTRKYDVKYATDVYEGLNLAARERPDLILLDIQMLGPSGMNITEYLRESPVTKRIPFVLTNGFVNKKELRTKQENSARYVSEKLFDRIVSMLEPSGPEDVVRARVNSRHN